MINSGTFTGAAKPGEEHKTSWSSSQFTGTLGLTRGADAVSIQDVVSPDGFAGGSVQHGPQDFIKGLIGVTPQCALGIFVDEASTES